MKSTHELSSGNVGRRPYRVGDKSQDRNESRAGTNEKVQNAGHDRRMTLFAIQRMDRIAERLGDDVVSKVFGEVAEKFKASCDPRLWEIFQRRDPAEWETVREETWRMMHGEVKGSETFPDDPKNEKDTNGTT